ncbi:15430_t:CDS:2 [Funneliformis geosporum]|uniref:19864_t:CDS:1 n=1 Tax=Funneliformis geosporum TaxID=1117311 RepID=A0A9W4WU33_9GLOM|nr:15430_t:CDS:2 [Funneliformis geosporum]CAI2185983.1 19864_t:CDS:2 [Funneliformis geosporum]
MVQRKLSDMFSSTKREKDSNEKDKPKKKIKQTVEKSVREGGQSIIVNEEGKSDPIIEENILLSSLEVSNSTSTRQKSRTKTSSSRPRILDESDDETFEEYNDVEAFVDENDVIPLEVSFPEVISEPEQSPRSDLDIRSKLKFHDEDFTPIDKFLHAFDLNYQFGPCVGLTRLARWERAHRLGLNPPKEVIDTLTSEAVKQNPKLNESVFFGRV